MQRAVRNIQLRLPRSLCYFSNTTGHRDGPQAKPATSERHATRSCLTPCLRPRFVDSSVAICCDQCLGWRGRSYPRLRCSERQRGRCGEAIVRVRTGSADGPPAAEPRESGEAGKQGGGCQEQAGGRLAGIGSDGAVHHTLRGKVDFFLMTKPIFVYVVVMLHHRD